MAMLEVMIQDFDKIRPIQSEIRLFPLINSDAENMVEKLTDLFEAEGVGAEGGETVRQFHFGEGFDDIEFASVGQELRFAADTRTNTLIAAGAEIDLRMVEELIRYLDAQEAEDRIVEVIHAKYRDAQDIASAIDSFNSQEQDVLGAGDDEESLQRRMERQVSVEAVGDEEEGSSSLILGTSRRMYQQTMEMVQQLDRPEPQVMISVLIAEVTLNDSVELGIEVAGQDLNFSEDAVLGPNGVIQGKGFDYVLGTDLGAAGLGLGGLNFTVTGEDFSFLLHALQQDSRLETLSRPILMVRNGEEGSIHIGDKVPYVESSRLSETGQTQSTIGREDIGVILTTTPHISPDGYVTIELKQELSGFTGENIQLTEGVSSPIITKREVETNVTVRDGETVVIGGLITSSSSEAENKVPLLGDLPLVGPVFRSTSVNEQQKELLVVLTVDILRSDSDRRKMSVEQRDKGVMSDSIRRHPLMEGLRILPEETALGPVDKKSKKPDKAAPTPVPRKQQRDLYGPKPKVYGPVIRRSTTSTVMKPEYGPRIAKSDIPSQG
jgi:type II secretion system protein D